MRAGIREPPRDLGKPQVVAGLQAKNDVVDLECLGLGDLAGADHVGLADAERVVEVDLAVQRGNRAVRAGRDQGVRDPVATRQRLVDARDHRDLPVLRQRAQSGDELAVQILRRADETVVHRGHGEHRVLGQDYDAGAARHGVADQTGYAREVVRLVVAWRELRHRHQHHADLRLRDPSSRVYRPGDRDGAPWTGGNDRNGR